MREPKKILHAKGFELIDIEYNLTDSSDGDPSGFVIGYIGFCADEPALMRSRHNYEYIFKTILMFLLF